MMKKSTNCKKLYFLNLIQFNWQNYCTFSDSANKICSSANFISSSVWSINIRLSISLPILDCFSPSTFTRTLVILQTKKNRWFRIECQIHFQIDPSDVILTFQRPFQHSSGSRFWMFRRALWSYCQHYWRNFSHWKSFCGLEKIEKLAKFLDSSNWLIENRNFKPDY